MMTRTVVLTLDGEFDITDRAELEQATVAAVEAADGGRVVVDLGGVTFMDSEAVAAIVLGYQAAVAAGCEYRLANAQGLVRRVLDIAGLLELIGVD
jgi:anti-anti-sigma factor